MRWFVAVSAIPRHLGLEKRGIKEVPIFQAKTLQTNKREWNHMKTKI